MKTRLIVFALGLLSLTSCYTSQTTSRRVVTSDDDIYYSKKSAANTESTPYPAQLPSRVQNNPSNTNQGNSRFYYDNPSKNNQGQYQDSLAQRTDSIHYSANSKFSNQNDNGTYDDYDYDYSSRINRFYYPYSGFGYYDPFYNPYSFYGFSPFNYGFGFGWNGGWNFGLGYGLGFGWGGYYAWGAPYGYYGGYNAGYYGGNYGGYYGGYNHGNYGGYGNQYGQNNSNGNGFIPGGNTYAPRRTIGGPSTFGNTPYNSARAISFNGGAPNASGNALGSRFISGGGPSNLPTRGVPNTSGGTPNGGFSNPNISRGAFNIPSRSNFSNSNMGRMSGIPNGYNGSSAPSGSGAGFRNPSLGNGNYNYTPNSASTPVATPINRANSGSRSSYFNSNQRFGGYAPSNQISRGYSAPSNSPNNFRSFTPPSNSGFQRTYSAPQRTFSAPAQSSFGGGASAPRSFGGGGNSGGGGGFRGGSRH